MANELNVKCPTCRAEVGQWCKKGWKKKSVTAKRFCRKRTKRAAAARPDQETPK